MSKVVDRATHPFYIGRLSGLRARTQKSLDHIYNDYEGLIFRFGEGARRLTERDAERRRINRANCGVSLLPPLIEAVGTASLSAFGKEVREITRPLHKKSFTDHVTCRFEETGEL